MQACAAAQAAQNSAVALKHADRALHMTYDRVTSHASGVKSRAEGVSENASSLRQCCCCCCCCVTGHQHNSASRDEATLCQLGI
jgi:hypothetical protein